MKATTVSVRLRIYSCDAKIPNKLSGAVAGEQLLYLSSYPGVLISFYLSLSLPLPPLPIEKLSFHSLSTSTYEFNDPSTSSLSDHQLHFHIMHMVQDQPFLGAINEDPYFHLEEFKKLCSLLVLPGETQEAIRWKLFPLSHRKGGAMVH